MYMKQIIKIFFLLQLALTGMPAFFSCSLPVMEHKEETVFHLPEEIPPLLSSWKIVIRSDTTSEEFIIPASQKKFSVFMNQNETVSVSAFPVIRSDKTDFFYPCGTVVPGTKNLTWEGGFSAFLYSIMVSQNSENEILKYFNWNRLTEELCIKEEKSIPKISTGGIYFNPWNLDLERLTEKIQNGKFILTDLKLLPQKSIPIQKTIFMEPETTLYSRYFPESRIISEYRKLFIYSSENISDIFMTVNLNRPPETFLLNYSEEYEKVFISTLN